VTTVLCHAGSFPILAKGSTLFSVVRSFDADRVHSWWCIFNDANHRWRWLL